MRNLSMTTTLAEAEEQVKTIMPPGYLELRLSTKGKLGAPEVFHIRNFKVADILALSLTNEQDLPVRVIQTLNDMIYEDVDVAQWHEKEVEETIVYIFINFYKSVLEDIPYPFSESELDAVKEKDEGVWNDIKAGRYVPKVNVNLAEDADIYQLQDDFHSWVKVTNKETGFHVTFGYIKYGDRLTVKKWLATEFKAEDDKFALLGEQIKYNNNIVNQLQDNPSKFTSIVPISEEDMAAYNEYSLRKLQAISEITKIISIIDYNGRDVSGLSAAEKYELMANDPRIDFGMITKLNKRMDKMKFGLKPEVQMRNPLTGEVTVKPFSFQLFPILSAMQVFGADAYDDGYDDEDIGDVE